MTVPTLACEHSALYSIRHIRKVKPYYYTKEPLPRVEPTTFKVATIADEETSRFKMANLITKSNTPV